MDDLFNAAIEEYDIEINKEMEKAFKNQEIEN